MTVVVVGAGLAGLRVAEVLRDAGYAGPLTVIGGESYPPYDRPPLSKEVLRGTRSAADIRLRDDEALGDLGVRLRLGTAAAGLDPERRQVLLADGEAVDFDRLVIATGVEPRSLSALRGMPGAHSLRTLDDCLGLRHSLHSARRVLVIGAGLIGCEVSASLRAEGRAVCLVEQQSAPLAAVFGDKVGELVARWHRDEGVDLRCGVGVAAAVGTPFGTRVTLTDGSEVEADVVVTGIGSTPATGWLQGSGVELGDGVLCDERGRTSLPDVWAVGDVAAWQSQGRRRRVEHWTNAGVQARAVARDMMGLPAEAAAVPYFWSDQYGLRIQAYGDFSADGDISVVEEDGRRFLATVVEDGVLAGVVGAGMAGKVARLRRTVGQAPR
ncbi:MAG TPA: FAD-dependent oxidoreductase [Kribbella sp.]|nr:FAD-dependent oxidoreductase [Amycolatopsis sp.]HWD77771.1 FAD-dependent oxidoreductase [Kribbella sp.]